MKVQMQIENNNNSQNIIIKTGSNSLCTIEISTFLGTIIFKDTIKPIRNTIEIIGLNPGKYIVHISNDLKTVKQQISILKN